MFLDSKPSLEVLIAVMFFTSLNRIRRKLTGILTKSIGGQKLKKIKPSEFSSIHTVLLARPNHRLGNQLLIAPLIQELHDHFPNAKIDLFLKGGQGPTLFKNYSIIDRFILLPKDHFKNIIQYFRCWISLRQKKYDLVLNVEPNSSSGRLATKISKGRIKIYGHNLDSHLELSGNPIHMAQVPIEIVRQFIDFSARKRFPSLKIKLSKEEIAEGKKQLTRLFSNNKETISIFTYATGRKCYSEDWWLLFYHSMKQKYGNEYNFLEILPKENISQIRFEATSFYSENIREIASVINSSKLFIAADSGIMHLGCATETSVMGLFSVTSREKYGPYGEKKISIDTNKSSIFDLFHTIEDLLNSKKKTHLIQEEFSFLVND